MAVVQFGVTVTGIRGTVGGLTFSANKGASYAKSFARPPSSHTPGQVEQRSRTVTAATAWSALTAGEKANWDAFALAPNENDYDPWGSLRYLTGFQWFVRSTTRRAAVGLSPSANTPSGAGLAAITGLTLSVDSNPGGNSNLAYDSGQFGATVSLIVFAAITPSQGGADAFTLWRQVWAEQNPNDTTTDIQSGLLAAFGIVPAGWKCYVRAFRQAEYGNRSSVATADAIAT